MSTELPDFPHVPVSVNMITKDNPQNTILTLDSVMGALDPDATGLDEIIMIDTGSTPRNLRKLREGLEHFANVTVVVCKNLSVPYEPFIEKYLGRIFVERFRKMVESGKCTLDGLMDFAKPRAIAKEHSKHDVIFWVDSDDLLVEQVPGKLRNVLNAVFAEKTQKEKDIGVLMLDYDYAFAPDGAVTTMLRRERFVRKKDFHWVGACHETLIPCVGGNAGTVAYFGDLKTKIVHSHNEKPTSWADIRNFIIISEDMQRERDEGLVVDPRSFYYLGNAARGLRLHKKALNLYKEFDRISGSVDDRFAANYFRGSIYLDGEMQRPFDALDAYWECVKAKPDDPRGYYGLQRAYLVLQRWEESLRWFQFGQALKIADNQVMSYDPTHVNYFPYFFAAHAAQEQGNFQLMMQCADTACRNRPGHEEAQQLLKNAKGRAAAHQLTQGVLFTAKHLKDDNPSNLVDALAIVPPDLEKMGLAGTEVADGRAPKPAIAIFCGPTPEEWGPGSRLTGMGGSEKMVVMLAERMQATGAVNVSVYASVPREQRGISAETGVRWEHWGSVDITRPRHAVIFWRCPGMIANLKIPAKYRVLWNHDVQKTSTYSPYVCAKLNFIQCQSMFHAEPLRGVVPEQKIWIARNAIESPKTRPELVRNPKQVVFCSSPDRGIKTAAEVVRRAQKLDPEISLVVTYGMNDWVRKHYAKNNHRHVPDVGHEICMDLYEREVHALLDEINATNLNRVSWEAMEVLMQSSGVWLYPTRFDEISCMSAMEALANGCVVVSTRYAALAETLGADEDVVGSYDLTLESIDPDGEVPEEWLDAAAQKLFKACNEIPAEHPARKLQARVALKRFNIDDLAEIWLNKLGLGDTLLAAEEDPQAGSVRPDPVFSESIGDFLERFDVPAMEFLFPELLRINDVEDNTVEEEYQLFYRMAARFGGPIFEQGSSWGCSTRHFHRGLETRGGSDKIYAVDTQHQWGTDGGEGITLSPGDMAYPLREEVSADIKDYLPPEPCVLGLEDGPHDYETTKAALAKQIEAGCSVILCHDCAPTLQKPGGSWDCRQAFFDVFVNHPEFGLWDIDCHAGILIAAKPGMIPERKQDGEAETRGSTTGRNLPVYPGRQRSVRGSNDYADSDRSAPADAPQGACTS